MHSNNDDPTGRHPDKTEAAIPKALNERADLVGQSYRERHRGQRAIGLQLKAGHMGAPLPYGVELKRALDRGVVPHMGIPNESQLRAVGIMDLRSLQTGHSPLRVNGKSVCSSPVHRRMKTKLCFIGHGLMENRHGLLVDACLTGMPNGSPRCT